MTGERVDPANLPLNSHQFTALKKSLALLGVKDFPEFVARVLHRPKMLYPVILTKDAALLAQTAQKEHDERVEAQKKRDRQPSLWPALFDEREV